jgi:hypothetical protein
LGFLEENIETFNYSQEDLINSTLTHQVISSGSSSNLMPANKKQQRSKLSRKRSQEKSSNLISETKAGEVYEMNEALLSSSTTTVTTTNRLLKKHDNNNLDEDNENEEEEDDDEDFSVITSTSNKRHRHISPFPPVASSSFSPTLSAAAAATGSSRQIPITSIRSSLSSLNNNKIVNEVVSATDFYSMDSAGESSYHTANEHDEFQPTFLKHLEPVTVLDGETATLECQIVGNPTVINWYKGESATIVRDSPPNFVYVKEPNNVYKLVIKEANLKDAGHYKIVASNHFGQAYSHCKLTVNEDLRRFDRLNAAQC